MNPRQTIDNPAMTYPAFFTWCSLCGEGDQVATRRGVEGAHAVYRSECEDCGEGFDVRITPGTPEEEAAAFFAEFDTQNRWRVTEADA